MLADDALAVAAFWDQARIDMTLRVVARHHGDAVARATARYMEYPFPEDNRRRV